MPHVRRSLERRLTPSKLTGSVEVLHKSMTDPVCMTTVDSPLDLAEPERALPDAPDVPFRDPRWVRPAVVTLLVATAVLYLWGLGASGWANDFYSAAVQAGTRSWKAFFFGSSDAANFITVDKPPASLWVMELSARVFGLNSWSILVPQALEGVAAVGLLYLTVRRWFGVHAGLIAGAVMAVTPVATLMFRFNNPDSLLVLLMVAAAYMVTRAVENGGTKWLVWAGVFLGLGFLTKMLQVFTVLPAFALAYLVAGPPKLAKRMWQLLLAGAAMLAAAGWWVAIVEWWPKSSRPYIGGSTSNSVLDLVFGYNGFGRLTGNETGSVVGGGRTPGPGVWGPTGWTRLFNSAWGGQSSWLIPTALLFGVVGLVLAGRHNRQDRIRTAVIMWGGWLFVTGAVFSFGQGIIHEYYTVALAPAIGALIGIGATVLWALREQWWGRVLLAVSVVTSAWWAWALLDRTPHWNAWLRPVLLAVAAMTVVGFLVGSLVGRGAAKWAAGAALVVALVGPSAYSIATAASTKDGAIPLAGPTVPDGRVGAGGRLPGGLPGGAPGGFPGGAHGGSPGGAPGGFPGGAPGGRGGVGGLLDGGTPSATVVTFLQDGKAGYTWTLATVGANRAAGFQLGTGDPVMAIGGFNGTDQWPTLAGFQQMVKDHRVHYFVAGGGFGPGGGGGNENGTAINDWVTNNFTEVTIDGTTFYDLGRPVN